jgi:hypothetical protein
MALSEPLANQCLSYFSRDVGPAAIIFESLDSLFIKYLTIFDSISIARIC